MVVVGGMEAGGLEVDGFGVAAAGLDGAGVDGCCTSGGALAGTSGCGVLRPVPCALAAQQQQKLKANSTIPAGAWRVIRCIRVQFPSKPAVLQYQ